MGPNGMMMRSSMGALQGHPGMGPGTRPMGSNQHGMSPGHPSQGPGQQHRMPGPPGGPPQPQQNMSMPSGHGSPMSQVPPSPHGMVPQSPLSQPQHMAPSPMSHPHMSPHPNMSPHPSHTPQHNTPTHQPGSREDFSLDFLDNIPSSKSQTPLTTTSAPNDQELLNLFT